MGQHKLMHLVQPNTSTYVDPFLLNILGQREYWVKCCLSSSHVRFEIRPF